MKNLLYLIFIPAVVVLSLFTSCENANYDAIEDAVYLGNAQGISKMETLIVEGSTVVFITVRTTKPASQDIKVKLKVDEPFITEYNDAYGSSYELLPEDFYRFETMEVTIPAGKAFATAEIVLEELSSEINKTGLTYALPVAIESVANGPDILRSASQYLIVMGRIPFSDVPEFKNYCVPNLLLSEDLSVENMTFEFLVYYASNTVSNGRKGVPFVMYNNDGTDPTAVNNGVFSRFGDDSRPGNHVNGNIRQLRFDFPAELVIPPYTWTHLAFEFDGSNCIWYMNGELAISTSPPASYGMTINKDKIYLARGDETDANGSVPLRFAEVRLWNTLRTTDQLKQNMYGVNPAADNLMGYWKLNEGEGLTLEDATGKNPDSKVIGTNASSLVWHQNQRIEIGY